MLAAAGLEGLVAWSALDRAGFGLDASGQRIGGSALAFAALWASWIWRTFSSAARM